MKQFYKDAVVGVLVSLLIVGGYACYDYMNTLSEPDYRITTPVPPYDFSSLPERKTINYNGKEINEKEFTRVLVLDTSYDPYAPRRNGIYASKVIGNSPSKYESLHYFDFNNDGFWERVPTLRWDANWILAYNDKAEDFTPGDIIGTYFSARRPDDGSAFSLLKYLNDNKDEITETSPVAGKLKLINQHGTDINVYKNSLQPLSNEIKLPLKLKIIPHREVTKEGNVLGDYIEVILKKGVKSKIQEVWLYTDPGMNGYYPPIPVTDEEIKSLPNIKGYGTLYSLHEAMQQDTSGQLKNKVRKYLTEPNYFIRRQLLLDILYLWAGCQNADPRSRLSENGKNYIGDARKQFFIEKVMGQPFRGTHTGKEETAAPHHASVFYLLDSFNKYADHIGLRLSFSGVLKPVFMAAGSRNGEIFQWMIDKIILNESIWGEPKINNKAVADSIKAFYTQNGELQAKLMLHELYNILKLAKEVDLYHALRHSGVIAPGIDMKDFGHFVIEGGANGENLYGTKGNDIFIGRDGNDAFLGKKGDDVYIFDLNEGDNVIIEEGGNDTIAFGAGIKPENIDMSLNGKDLLIKINGGESGSIHVRDYTVDDKYKIENLLFADGLRLNIASMLSPE